jgi:hypothetical protein
MEANQGWLLLLQVGLHHAILWTPEILYAFLGLEAMGSTEVQNLCLVDHPK